MRLVKSIEFPFSSSKESRWYSWLTTSPSSWPEFFATALPSLQISVTSTSCQAPRDSTARGMKAQPCCWQATAESLTFLSKATVKAWPGVAAASPLNSNFFNESFLLFAELKDQKVVWSQL